jgi:hypothetical protein
LTAHLALSYCQQFWHLTLLCGERRAVVTKRVLIAAVALLIAGTFVSAASANKFAYMFWGPAGSPTNWVGVRSSIGNPDSSQRSVSAGDFLSTSVVAANGLFGTNGRAVEQGVNYEYQAGEGPSCNKGSSAPAMYNYVEIDDHDNYSCYYESDAASATSHVQKAEKDSGYWGGYLDGNYQGHHISWTACNGNACYLQALGEDLSDKSGLWYAKFSGSGNTPWQFNNGTLWSTINDAGEYLDNPPWSKNETNFPNGLWWYLYSK